MSDLANFAKKDKIKTGYTPWREKSPENEKAWAEAVDGYKSGISASVQPQLLTFWLLFSREEFFNLFYPNFKIY